MEGKGVSKNICFLQEWTVISVCRLLFILGYFIKDILYKNDYLSSRWVVCFLCLFTIRFYRLKFDCVESCSLWYGRLKEKAEIPDHLEKLFAFSYHTSCQDLVSINQPLSDNHNVGFLNLKGEKECC